MEEKKAVQKRVRKTAPKKNKKAEIEKKEPVIEEMKETNEEDKILEAKDLRISFKTNNGTVKAVRGVSFSLYRGRTLGIVGESGSGKSVTSRAILGILAGNKIIEGGQILYDGRDLLKLREEDFTRIRGSKIAMIFQDPMSSLNPLMKVGKQLTEAMVLKHKSSKKEAKANIKKILSIIHQRADEAQMDVKHVTELLQRFEKNALTKINHIQNSDQAMANELFTICFNSPYSRYQAIDDDATETLMNCVLPSEFESFGEMSQEEGKNKKLKRKMAEAKKRRIRVIRALKENVISKDDELTEEEKEEIRELFGLTVEQEYQISLQNKKDFIAFIQKTMETYFNDYESYQPAVLKKELKAFDHAVALAQYRLAENKDDVALTLVPTLRGYIADYYNAVALVNKKLKEDAKKASKNISTDPTLKERMYGSEVIITPEEVYQKTKNALQDFISYYEHALENETYDKNAYTENLISYLERCYGDSRHVLTKQDIRDRAIELLGEVGIPEPQKRFNQYPFQFSGGMRQRIVIAIALSANPDILICDEPTTALDVTIQSQILELINRLKEEKRLSVIFITHDLGVIANMADDIAVMYAGKIVEYGKVDEIFYDPRHPYTWALLSSMPDLNTKEELEAIPGTPPNMILPPKGDAFAARNKYAMKIDFEEEPPLFKVTDTHYAATWLLHPKAPKVKPPKIVTERIRIAKERQKERGEKDA